MQSPLIVVLVVMILLGTLIWRVNDALVDTSYIMEYSGFDVWLGKNNQFQKLKLLRSETKSPLSISHSLLANGTTFPNRGSS